MRKSFFAPSIFAWALAAIVAVSLSAAPSAWAAASASQQISAQLPAGVTLAKASVAQTAAALHDAVAKSPESAASLTSTALVAKTKSKGKRLTPGEVKSIVQAAMSAAPDKSSDIIQAALSVYPEYADQLSDLTLNPGSNAPDGFNTPQDLYGGFGVGFGPGFPGSPGFTGSPPSGAIALPPSVVTAVLNG